MLGAGCRDKPRRRTHSPRAVRNQLSSTYSSVSRCAGNSWYPPGRPAPPRMNFRAAELSPPAKRVTAYSPAKRFGAWLRAKPLPEGSLWADLPPPPSVLPSLPKDGGYKGRTCSRERRQTPPPEHRREREGPDCNSCQEQSRCPTGESRRSFFCRSFHGFILLPHPMRARIGI